MRDDPPERETPGLGGTRRKTEFLNPFYGLIPKTANPNAYPAYHQLERLPLSRHEAACWLVGAKRCKEEARRIGREWSRTKDEIAWQLFTHLANRATAIENTVGKWKRVVRN